MVSASAITATVWLPKEIGGVAQRMPKSRSAKLRVGIGAIDAFGRASSFSTSVKLHGRQAAHELSPPARCGACPSLRRAR